MAATSLFFGGLSLMHAHQGATAQGTLASTSLFSIPTASELMRRIALALDSLLHALSTASDLLLAVDIRTLLWTAAGLLSILTIAYWTNPSDASFRTFLADLSLHQHLRQLHEDAPPVAPVLALSSEKQDDIGSDALDELSIRAAEQQTSPHVITFANRISISLRTPPYRRRDLGLFTVVSVTHVPTDGHRGSSNFSARRPGADGKVDCAHCGTRHVAGPLQQKSWFVGAFGRWFGGTLSCALESRLDRADRAERADGGSASTASSGQTDDDYGVLGMLAHDEARATPDDSPTRDEYEAGEPASPLIESAAEKQTTTLEDEHSEKPGASTRPSKSRRKKHLQRPRPSQPLPTKEAVVSDLKASAEPGKRSDHDTRASRVTPTANTPRDAQASSPAIKCSETSAIMNKVGAASPALLALAQQLATSNSAAAELQAALDQIHANSGTTREQLQAQLDELRERKREEDGTRLDLRGRMRGLDDSRRQADNSKRDAERRLKAAVGLREAIEGRIEARRKDVAALHKRETASARRVSENQRHLAEKALEVEQESSEKAKAEEDAVRDIEELRERLRHLEKRLSEEEANLQACKEQAIVQHRAHQLAHETQSASNATAAHHPSVPPHLQHHPHHPPQHVVPQHYAYPFYDPSIHGSLPPQAPQSNIYPLLSAPSDNAATDRRDSEDEFGPAPFDFGWSSGRTERARAEAAAAAASTFSPQLIVPVDQEQHPDADVSRRGSRRASDFIPGFENAHTGHRSDLTPGVVDSNLLHARRGAEGYMSLSGAINGNTITPPRQYVGMDAAVPATPFTPLSPFSTDLLPRNLFLNADDDETHAGILPGSRSEQVEAALGRLGLESDTSDVEGSLASDKDAKEGALEHSVVTGPADLAETVEPTQTESTGAGDVATKVSRRSWWGGKGRPSSKGEPQAEKPELQGSVSPPTPMVEVAPGTSGENVKRRSSSIFPRLSLNPGAKAFRSGSRNKHSSDGPDSALSINRPVIRGPLDAWPIANQPVIPSDYDAVRRAFDTSATADEEQGRRSWSAFDTWVHAAHSPTQGPSQESDPRIAALLNSRRDGAATDKHDHGLGGRHPYLHSSGALSGFRSSSDSLPRGGAPGRPSGECANRSTDDVFSPLSRTISHPESSVASSSPDVRTSRLRSFFRGTPSGADLDSTVEQSSTSPKTTRDSASEAGLPEEATSAAFSNGGSATHSSSTPPPGASHTDAVISNSYIDHANPSANFSSPSKKRQAFRWSTSAKRSVEESSDVQTNRLFE
ncbi:hypothetical protein CBOM_02005 [Ceraceosorus bombacis]|uniref:Proteophosphoglycan ppg4 n=1 Tax=Ceraceosorus bombacis TaxID=401625 RepID=A0A0P1BD89_9BASI|nr:hypothetical protein CBOM_02005 [Ceraceosorus bombacis]